jgi:hypothetical protein
MYYRGEWYRPDEIFEVVEVEIDIIYNLYCEPYHEVY